MNGFTFHSGVLPLITVDSFMNHGCFGGFTTRFGGISAPPYDSLNLSYSPQRDDPICNVETNWAILTAALSCSKDHLITTRQTHSANVVYVDKPLDFSDKKYADGIDGVVTDRSDLLLSVVTADCQGLLFFDPKKKVYAAVHSGWRGTLSNIGGIALEKMKQLGCHPKNILVAGGPSIQRCCFEVGTDVVDAFVGAYGKRAFSYFAPTEKHGKFMGDLPAFTRDLMISQGILPQNVSQYPCCTCCDSRFFSHRRQKGQRGTMAALIIGKDWKIK